MKPAIINAVRCKSLKEVDELIDIFSNVGMYSKLPPKMYVNKAIEQKIINQRKSSYPTPLMYRTIICEVKE